MSTSLPPRFTRPDKVVFAIDYGTSNSLLAATDGTIETSPLPLDELAADPTVFRSVLFFPNQLKCFYGQKAVDEYGESQASGRLIRSIKKYLPSESYQGSWIEDRVVKLEDLIGFFLLELKKRASLQLQVDVETVVLGRPAKFSDDPVKDKLAQFRLEKAANLAGFKNVTFVPEPLAAALDLRRRLQDEKTVLVVDLGGGTSDFTVIKISPNAFKDEDVLAIGGVSVAGDAVDGEFMKSQVAPFFGSRVRYKVPLGSNVLEMPKSLLDHICSPADIAQLRRSDHYEFFRQLQQWALKKEDKAKLESLFVLVEDQLGFRLFEEIDRTKRGFSNASRSRFDFDYPDIDIHFDLDAVDFEVSINRPVDTILEALDETLKAAGLTAEQIDIVYCTGGSSKLRLVQKGLLKRFSAEKIVGKDYFHSVIQGLVARAQEISAQS